MRRVSLQPRLLLPVLAALALSACVAPFEARVARFQQLPPPSGNSFAIEPRNKANEGGLEFATYAAQVKQKLVALGFTEAASPDAAQYLVQLDYNVSAPREKVESRPGLWGGWGGWGLAGRGWGPYWGWGGWGGWGWGGPGFGGWGGGWGNTEVYSVTQYNAVVALRIARAADKQSVFEGRAETVSTSNNLPKLVPNLLTAMFTNFPGTSGETVVVRFDPTKPGAVPTVKPIK